jgi:hypothetical protein
MHDGLDRQAGWCIRLIIIIILMIVQELGTGDWMRQASSSQAAPPTYRSDENSLAVVLSPDTQRRLQRQQNRATPCSSQIYSRTMVRFFLGRSGRQGWRLSRCRARLHRGPGQPLLGGASGCRCELVQGCGLTGVARIALAGLGHVGGGYASENVIHVQASAAVSSIGR